MTDAVRLVIWDLDETFWRGTLTEGGIIYQDDIHNIVITLAQRGIMSSICSKNDFEEVRSLLIARGIWEYFIFPSINWNPKGPRLTHIVELVQLRAASILFIDDNPMNRNEALHFVPDLQVASDSIAGGLLSDPRCEGGHDGGLKRLGHYKLLEKKKADEILIGGGNLDFLRASGIRVAIVTEVESHLDRCVELINRTNQLNFTKRRLPADADLARQELAQELATYRAQGGLIRVKDKYGDYGYCGFYLFDVITRSLTHFCFSCRIINMGVEQWMYQRIGRPALEIRGDVISDLNHPASVDWITYEPDDATAADKTRELYKSVYVRGGCDLEIAAFYFGLVAPKIVGEFNAFRRGLSLRFDHSAALPLILQDLSAAEMRALEGLGFIQDDFQSNLSMHPRHDLYILSFQADASFGIYRHRQTGVVVPHQAWWSDDLTLFTDEQLDLAFNVEEQRRMAYVIKREYDYIGLIQEDMFKHNLGLLRAVIPESGEIIIFEPIDRWVAELPRSFSFAHRANLNRWVRESFEGRRRIRFLNAADFLDDDPLSDPNHFARSVYFRVFNAMARENEGLNSISLTG